MRSWAERYREQGRQEMLRKFIQKFEELYDQYYAQGDQRAADLTVDMVAYLQDDFDEMGNK